MNGMSKNSKSGDVQKFQRPRLKLGHHSDEVLIGDPGYMIERVELDPVFFSLNKHILENS